MAPKGNFVNTKGEILGTHEGITHYTVGQRRGLGLPMGHRVFVLEIRPETNEVVVGENEEVFAKVVKANKVNYMAIPPLELGEELSCTAKIRYGHKGSPCVIKRTGEDEITCTFSDGVRAPTRDRLLSSTWTAVSAEAERLRRPKDENSGLSYAQFLFK